MGDGLGIGCGTYSSGAALSLLYFCLGEEKRNILLRSVLLASRLYCVARFFLPREQLGVSCAAGAYPVARNASFAVDTGVRPKCNATLTELGHGLQRQSWLHIWEELKLPRCNQGFFIFIAE